MCGLIGWISKDNDLRCHVAVDAVGEQYERQKTRGSRGFGLTSIDDTGFVRVQRSKDEPKMLANLSANQDRHIILHHRMPTSTSNTVDQTHPIVVINEELKFEYLMHHNGVISNAKELFAKHKELKYEYSTLSIERYNANSPEREVFNDSEAFAIEMARYLENKTDVISSKGNQAFILVKMKDQFVVDIIIGTNGGHPMGLWDAGIGWEFASEETGGEELTAFQAHTFRARYSKNGSKLLGFKLIKDLPELQWPEEKKPEPVVSHYMDQDDDEVYSTGGMGFHAHGAPTTNVTGRFIAAPPALPPANVPARDAGVESYAKILHNVRNTGIGKVFEDHKDSEVIKNFPYKEMAATYARGEIEKIDEAWDQYQEGVRDTLDIDFETVIAMTAEEGPNFKSAKNMEDIEREAKGCVGRKMKVLAEHFVPLFKLQVFMETIIAMGYQLQGIQEDHESNQGAVINLGNDDELTEDERKAAEGALASVADPLLESKDEHFTRLGVHNPADCSRPELHVRTVVSFAEQKKLHFEAQGMHSWTECERPEFHSPNDQVPVQSPKEKAEEEAVLLLQILGESAETMQPEDVMTEAAGVGDGLLLAAKTAIDEALTKMATIAGEEGVPLSVPFYARQLTEAVEKVQRRFTTLAQIVKAAKELEEIQSYNHS